MSDNITITSGFETLKEFQKIAKSLFGEDASDKTISMIGYVSTIAAEGIDNAIIDQKIEAQEILVSTCRSRRRLYQEAVIVNAPITNANPAIMDVLIGIPRDALFNQQLVTDDEYNMTISADTVITILDKKFLLDYDILLNAKKNTTGTEYVYSARYNTTDNNPISDVKHPYLQSLRMDKDGIPYIMIRVTVRQLTEINGYHTVTQNDTMSILGEMFDYTNQLAYFNVWYRESEYSDWKIIDKHSIFDKTIYEKDYIKYDDSETGYITIKAAGTFSPVFNSELRIDIFTTEGTGGNFVYQNGNTDVQLLDNTGKIDYTGIGAIVEPINNAVQGTDSPTIEQLRAAIIQFKSTRNALDTEPDLQKFFNSAIADTNIEFIKKRADVEERIYSSFLLLRDESNSIIPSGTMNLRYNSTDFDHHYSETNRRVIKANTKFTLNDYTTDKYLLKKYTGNTDIETMKTVEADPTQLLFGTPYLVILNEEGFNSSEFYNNSVDKELNVKTTYINEAADNHFIINKFKITRDAVSGEDQYNITLNVIPTGDHSALLTPEETPKPDELVMKLYVYSEDAVMYYADTTLVSYDKENKYFVFSCTLTTDDYLSTDNKLRITNTLYPKGTSVKEDSLINSDATRFGFALYVKTDNHVITPYEPIVPNFTAYNLCDVYDNDDFRAPLFTDFTDITRATVTMPEADVYLFDSVPLVKATSLLNDVSRVSSLLVESKNVFSSIQNRIIEGFTLDFKFIRTYGSSTLFTTTGETKLTKLDLSATFNVKLKASYSGTKQDAIDSIKSNIKAYLENINTVEDKSRYMTNLTTHIETNVDVVQAIDITELNGVTPPPRVITYNPPDTSVKANNKNFVPEFLNISTSDITINTY